MRPGAVLMLLLWVMAGCGRAAGEGPDGGVVTADGGTAQVDGKVVVDAGEMGASFVAVGCEAMEEWTADGGLNDAGEPPRGQVCLGRAPLTLTFVPVTSPGVTTHLWSFDDADADAGPVRSETPTYTFDLPGAYDVTLTVGGPGGTLTVDPDPPFVQVLANETGAACDLDAQCQPGLQCVCLEAEQDDPECASAFGGRGLCSRVCSDSLDCEPGALCVDLSEGAPWRERLCLASCSEAAPCADSLACRALPSTDATGEWVSACFVSFLGDVGASCFDGSGSVVHSGCVAGLCLDLGVAGYCSAPCGVSSCPPGTACARFADGETVCLAACATTACDGDPLLGCEVPDSRGTLGFEIMTTDPPPPPGPYCAPRRCEGPEDCAGLPCAVLGDATFCQLP